MEIPVWTVTLDEMMVTLAERSRACGMSSEEMSRRFSAGTVPETEELLKWMQAYHVHQYLNS